MYSIANYAYCDIYIVGGDDDMAAPSGFYQAKIPTQVGNRNVFHPENVRVFLLNIIDRNIGFIPGYVFHAASRITYGSLYVPN